MSARMRQAVFLDRDGTINEDVGYISQPEDVAMIPRAAEAIKRLNQAGLAVIVVTNQSGLARGYFGEGEMHAVQAEVERRLAEHGAHLDGFYFCPHLPEGDVEYLAIECDCRKPSSGMLIKAAQEHGVDLAGSFMVGDRLSDVACGKAVGARSIMVATGYDADDPAGVHETPDFQAADLAEAVDWILQQSPITA